MQNKEFVAEYEAPIVEAVMNAEDVEREVHYAGIITMIPQ